MGVKSSIYRRIGAVIVADLVACLLTAILSAGLEGSLHRDDIVASAAVRAWWEAGAALADASVGPTNGPEQ